MSNALKSRSIYHVETFFQVCLEILSLGIIRSKTFLYENKIKEFGPQHDTGLTFEAYPKSEGLVGKCYREGSVCIAKEFNPNHRSLNLAPYQIDKLLDVKFYACCPVYMTKRKITAILVLESRVPIQYDDRLDKLFHKKNERVPGPVGTGIPDYF